MPSTFKNAVDSIGDKELIARGWKDAELKQIIHDFEQAHRDRLSPDFSTEIHAEGKGDLRITFTTNIEPRLFCWLINYIQYPKGFDLESREILVAGNAIINSDFLPSEQSLIGKHITFYTPTDDDQYDVVFAQVDGQSYEFPFSSERWRRVQEARLPSWSQQSERSLKKSSKRSRKPAIRQRLLGLILFTLAGLLAIYIFWCGTYGLYFDDVKLYNPRRAAPPAHFHGIAAWLLVGSYYSVAVFLASIVFRFCFDHNPGRSFYKTFNRWLKYIGWSFFVGAIITGILLFHKK
jgi:hypothetical protein